jgi:N6-adenosine-specific RNA methylase IME4
MSPATPMPLHIDSRIRDLIPPLSEDEFRRLESSILTEGIRDAIIMWHPPVGQPCILDGHNRYKIACEHGLGYTLESLNLRTLEEAQRWVIDNQLARRNLSDFSRGELAVKLLAIEQGAARQRMSQGGQGVEPVPHHEQGKARDKAAALVGISGRQLDKVRFVTEHADEGTLGALRAGTTTVGAEHRRIKAEQKKAAAIDAVESKPEPLPDGPFDVIVADFPWAYGLRSEDATHRNREPYPPMTRKQVREFPMAKLAADDCILWLWVTNAHLLDLTALEALDEWGFEPKTMLTWAKPSIGAGHWLRGQTEHCIMAVKGKPVHDLKGQSTLLEAPRREHSRKPEEFMELVESLCPGSKVELFAREQREGWSAWGAEKEKFDGQESTG